MDSTSLTPLQQTIASALEKLGEKKAPYPDSILAKEVRSVAHIQNKKTASLRVSDIEQAISALEAAGKGCWSLKLDSVNNILIKKVESTLFLSPEDKRNRQRTEKSLTLLTDNDISNATKQKPLKKKKESKWRYNDEE